MKKVLFSVSFLVAVSVSAMTFTDYVGADLKSINGKKDAKAFATETPEIAKCLADRYAALSSKVNTTPYNNLKKYCEYVTAKKDLTTLKDSNVKIIYILGNVSNPASCKNLKLDGDKAVMGLNWFFGAEECSTVTFN
jgi:hypothetical protein